MHRVVKSFEEVRIEGTVPIDNTVIKRATVHCDNPEEQRISERIETEVQNRMASIQRELSEKEKQAFEEVNDKKAAILAKAHTEAERIMRDARLEAEIFKETARQQGHSEGYSDGLLKGEEQAQKYVKAAAAFLAEIKENKDALYIQYENELLELSFEMAKKIIKQELKADKDAIFSIVKQACRSFRSSDYIKISLAKGDVSETVASDIEFLKKLVSNNTEVELELLPDAKSGTVIIDDDKEIIDASVPTQLELLKEIVKNSKRPIE